MAIAAVAVIMVVVIPQFEQIFIGLLGPGELLPLPTRILLAVSDFFHHNWYASTFSSLSMVTLLIVWGALPFVVVTVYAGLSQVPHELVEAAEIDGARPWRVFKDVTVPILKSIFLILTSLSIIWDFGVFTQAYLVTGELGNRDEYNLGIYVYDRAFTMPPSYGIGSALALILTVILLIITIGYVRASVRQGAVQ